jgi:hypothetical protein
VGHTVKASRFTGGAQGLRAAAMAALLAAAALCAASCGARSYPSEFHDAEAMTKSHVAAAAKRLAPDTWKLGADALEQCRAYAKKGKEPEARLAAMEALVHFKTAVARAEGIVAEERIRDAVDLGLHYENEKEKFTVLRQDAEKRFLNVMAYHLEQKDDAQVRKSNFDKDREKYLELSQEEKETWDKEARPGLRKNLQHAEALIAAAGLLVSQGSPAAAQKAEAEKALETAAGAVEGSWESARPLVDEAMMKAERLLAHARILAKPDPLENPASDGDTFKMVKKNLEPLGALVSATFKGILVALPDPWDAGKGALTKSATKALEEIAGLLKGRERPLVLIQSYHFEADSDKADTTAEAMALTAQAGLEKGKVPAEGMASKSWGNAVPYDAGPCLGQVCADGRLDIFIVSY